MQQYLNQSNVQPWNVSTTDGIKLNVKHSRCPQGIDLCDTLDCSIQPRREGTMRWANYTVYNDEDDLDVFLVVTALPNQDQLKELTGVLGRGCNATILQVSHVDQCNLSKCELTQKRVIRPLTVMKVTVDDQGISQKDNSSESTLTASTLTVNSDYQDSYYVDCDTLTGVTDVPVFTRKAPQYETVKRHHYHRHQREQRKSSKSTDRSLSGKTVNSPM